MCLIFIFLRSCCLFCKDCVSLASQPHEVPCLTFNRAQTDSNLPRSCFLSQQVLKPCKKASEAEKICTRDRQRRQRRQQRRLLCGRQCGCHCPVHYAAGTGGGSCRQNSSSQVLSSACMHARTRRMHGTGAHAGNILYQERQCTSSIVCADAVCAVKIAFFYIILSCPIQHSNGADRWPLDAVVILQNAS